ncbi:MAG: alpha/beta fold hydrolase [Bacteroidetes bacterium]|nr:alpha/beta fold hydrolase [Bacteroidota bacterium]
MKKALLIFSIRVYFNTLAWIAPAKAGREGFYLFCKPRRRSVKPHHMEFLDTSEKFTIDYAGKKVQGYKWGTGEKKLLLVHGWESHSYWWKNIVSALSKEKFTIYAIDAPGHGLSEGNYINIPHYSALIEKIILEHKNIYAILSHSLGSFSSIYTLHRAPHLPVSKLVMMAAPGEVTEFVDFYKKFLGLSSRTMNEISKYFIQKIGRGPEYFSLKEFAKSMNLPGLIIHDTEDQEAPYQYALAAHQNWPNSEMITTSGLGHNLKSMELVKNVEEFLGQEVLQAETQSR